MSEPSVLQSPTALYRELLEIYGNEASIFEQNFLPNDIPRKFSMKFFESIRESDPQFYHSFHYLVMECGQLEEFKKGISNATDAIDKAFALSVCESCECQSSVSGPFCNYCTQIRCCEILRGRILCMKDKFKSFNHNREFFFQKIKEYQFESGEMLVLDRSIGIELTFLGPIYVQVIENQGHEITRGNDMSNPLCGLQCCYGVEPSCGDFSTRGSVKGYRKKQSYLKIEPWTFGILYRDEQNLYFESNGSSILLAKNLFTHDSSNKFYMKFNLKNVSVRIGLQTEGIPSLK